MRYLLPLSTPPPFLFSPSFFTSFSLFLLSQVVPAVGVGEGRWEPANISAQKQFREKKNSLSFYNSDTKKMFTEVYRYDFFSSTFPPTETTKTTAPLI